MRRPLAATGRPVDPGTLRVGFPRFPPSKSGGAHQLTGATAQHTCHVVVMKIWSLGSLFRQAAFFPRSCKRKWDDGQDKCFTNHKMQYKQRCEKCFPLLPSCHLISHTHHLWFRKLKYYRQWLANSTGAQLPQIVTLWKLRSSCQIFVFFKPKSWVFVFSKLNVKCF